MNAAPEGLGYPITICRGALSQAQQYMKLDRKVLIVTDDGVPGVVVADTHCIRIAGLLGLTDGTKDPAKVEMQLRQILPPEESNNFCHRLVLHGRAVCIARRPQCQSCTLRPWCDHFIKQQTEEP